jgi:hypothetical protein
MLSGVAFIFLSHSSRALKQSHPCWGFNLEPERHIERRRPKSSLHKKTYGPHQKLLLCRIGGFYDFFMKSPPYWFSHEAVF